MVDATNIVWPVFASSYKLKKPIGSGAFGFVWQAKVLKPEIPIRKVAIKVIDMEQFSDESIDTLSKETSLMGECDHKNVVRCYTSFVEGTDLWLVMPLLNAGSC
jgi:serine/threonine-protein kinase OSR1/STK39